MAPTLRSRLLAARLRDVDSAAAAAAARAFAWSTATWRVATPSSYEPISASSAASASRRAASSATVAAVFAAQPRQQEQPLFDLRQPRWIRPHAARVAPQVAGDVVDGGRRLRQPLGQRRQRRIQRHQRLEVAQHGRDPLADRAVAGVQRLLAARRRREEAVGGAQALALGGQRRVFTRHRLCRVQLAELKAEHVLAFGPGARVGRERRQRRRRLDRR